MSKKQQSSSDSTMPSLRMAVSREGKLRWEWLQSKGVPLEDYLLSFVRDTPDEAELAKTHKDLVEVVMHVAEALAKGHEQGIAHRNLTLEKVLVGEQSEIWLQGWQKGVLDEESLDLAVQEDLRSLGEALARILSLRAKTGFGDGFANWVPAPLVQIVDKLLAGGHYATPRALGVDLKHYIQGDEVGAAPDPLARKLWRKAGSRPGSVLLALTCVLALLGATTAFFVLQVQKVEALTRQSAELANDRLEAVAKRGAQFEARVQSVEVQLARLAASLKQVMIRVSPKGLTYYQPEQLQDNAIIKNAHYLPRFDQVVSLETPIIAIAPRVDDNAAENDAQRLTSLNYEFVDSFAKAGKLRGSKSNKNDKAPAQWTYAATPSGVLINFPGTGGLSKEYDPRTRPWYTDTVGQTGPIWGTLYGDAGGSGTQLPCNQAIYSAEKKLLGVVGIDFRLADIRVAMFLDDMTGYEGSWLLNKDGMIIVEAQQTAAQKKDEFTADRAKLKQFPVEEVLSKIWKSPHSGQVHLGEHDYFYSEVATLNWFYLAKFKR